MKLLIVEDDIAQAEALRRLLKARMEYLDCKIVPTLAEALRWSKDFKADVTLLDLQLPDATMDEVIEAIPNFHPPVIVVTSVDDPSNEIMMKCFAYEAKGFHSKEELLDRIDSIPGRIAANTLTQSIIDSHFRHVLPERRRQEQLIAKDDR